MGTFPSSMLVCQRVMIIFMQFSECFFFYLWGNGSKWKRHLILVKIVKFHAVFVKLSGCLFFWRGKRERVKFFHGIGWFFILFFPIWFQGLDDFRMRPQVILSQNLGFSFPQGEICFFSLEGFLSFWVKRRFSAFQVVATFSMASCDLSGCPDEWFANMTYSQDESPEKWSNSSTVGESSPK